MADKGHLEILERGVEAWNEWRRTNLEIEPDLKFADFARANLSHANFFEASLPGANIAYTNLSCADLRRANIVRADIIGANLTDANLMRADLVRADLGSAVLRGAQLINANLIGANLSEVDLRSANLAGAKLIGANLTGSNLSGANVAHAIARKTVFANIDLREVGGLESVEHEGASEISISTLYLSEGKIPEVFLRGCGVPESVIVQIPALVAAMQPIQFYSCFISYSGKDEEFARRLHSRMREAELRVWFAPEDMKGGDKLYDQIDRAIQVHDRLLLVLSESSLKSKWVETEIRRARKVELREHRRKLFPIRLVSYETLQEWVCIDSTTGEDLAEEVRSYFIPDFSTWKNHDDLEQAFARLLADLKASA